MSWITWQLLANFIEIVLTIIFVMKSTLDRKSMAFELWFQVHKIERTLSSLHQTLCQIASSSGKIPVLKRIEEREYLVQIVQI